MIFRVVSLGGIFSIAILVGWRSLRIGVLVSLVSSSLIFSVIFGLSVLGIIIGVIFSVIFCIIFSILIVVCRFGSIWSRVSKNRSGI